MPYNLCRHVIHRRADLSVVTTTRLIPHTLTHGLRYHSIEKGKDLELKLTLHSSCFFGPKSNNSVKIKVGDRGNKILDQKKKESVQVIFYVRSITRYGVRTCPTTKTISRVYYLYICNKVPVTIVSN